MGKYGQTKCRYYSNERMKTGVLIHRMFPRGRFHRLKTLNNPMSLLLKL